MITKRGQSVALMITIIGRIHEDQQVPRPCRGLQGRVQHALRESNRARPGQHPDGTRTPAAQTERNGVGGVVSWRAASMIACCLSRAICPCARPFKTSETALRDTPTRSATSCAVALRATVPCFSRALPANTLCRLTRSLEFDVFPHATKRPQLSPPAGEPRRMGLG
jgi:hypothetical protein